MIPSQPPDAWDAALAVAREGRETAALRRLAKACRSMGLAPSFDVADRDRLRAKLDVEIKDGGAVINAGLKALGKIAARHPELAISACPKILSASEAARAAHRLRFGPAFEASIEAYVTASNAPVDAYGRRRIVGKSIGEKHPTALRLAAHICAKAKLPAVMDIADLLQRDYRDAIIAHYGPPALGCGGRSTLLSVLMKVAQFKNNQPAIDDIKRQVSVMGKAGHALPRTTLRKLAPFHDIRRQTAMLAAISAVVATLTAGWPRVWCLRRCQAALALMLSFYLLANPEFVWSIGFDPGDDALRQTPWGPRPRLVARCAPHEPLEVALPDALVSLVDVYWAQMPASLRKSREVFVTDQGDRTSKTGFVKRNVMLLAELAIKLTPHMLVDLGVMNMVWLNTMTEEEMAIKARFSGRKAFKKRYDILMGDVEGQRRQTKQRPGTARTGP